MEFNTITVTVMDESRGSTMVKKSWKILQPSMIPASSIPLGTPFTKPWYRNTDMLSPNPPYMNTSPVTFFSPRVSKNWISGYMIAWNGMSMAATKAMKMTCDHLVWLRTSIHAPIEEMITISPTETNVIEKVIPNERKKWIS